MFKFLKAATHRKEGDLNVYMMGLGFLLIVGIVALLIADREFEFFLVNIGLFLLGGLVGYAVDLIIFELKVPSSKEDLTNYSLQSLRRAALVIAAGLACSSDVTTNFDIHKHTLEDVISPSVAIERPVEN